MKKLSKISFRSVLNEDEMKKVVGGSRNANCSSTVATNCDGLCAPSFDGQGGVTTKKCSLFYIQGLNGGKVAACGC